MEGHPVRLEAQDVCDSGGRGGVGLFAGEEMKKPGKHWIPLSCDICKVQVGYYNPYKIGRPASVRCSSHLLKHGPEVSRECIEYLTKIEKRTRDIIEWLEEPWDDPNAVIDEMTIRLKRLLQDTMGRR